MDSEELLTVPAAAAEIGRQRDQLLKAIRLGVLPAVASDDPAGRKAGGGRYYLIRRADLTAYQTRIAERKARPAMTNAERQRRKRERAQGRSDGHQVDGGG